MSVKDVKDHLEDGKITDEGLEQLRKLDGTKLRTDLYEHYKLASKETIAHFVNGLGDPNPLYNDAEYAKKTRYGALVAPPSYPYTTIGAGVMHGLRGVHSFHAGDDWEFYLPVLEGDVLTGEAIARGYEEVPNAHFAKRMIKQLQERRYTNQRGEVVAKAIRWNMRTERGSARETGKYSKIELPHPWKPEELAAIEDQQFNHHARGAEVRYWEDVTVGEELPPLIKGPMSLLDELAFSAATYNYMMAGMIAMRNYRKHPAWAYRDPDTCALEPVAAVHWSKRAAAMTGLPYPYAVGMEMNSWFINLFTDWMGDEGWLKRCRAEYRSFVYFSDVVWNKGTVVKKYVDENGEYCADIEGTAPNQRGQETIKGFATVILPSRDAGTWPVAKRLPPK
jgi:acyl dehydratase